MDSKLLKYLSTMYALKNIIRYNNIPHLQHETVAEHSYFTALIVRKLREKYVFDEMKAVEMALIHDIHEIYLGDIVSPIKAKFPGLKNMLKNVEAEVVYQFFPDEENLMTELQKRDSIEAKIVKIADMYSVVQYTSNELILGNNPEMKRIQEEVKRKIMVAEIEMNELQKRTVLV